MKKILVIEDVDDNRELLVQFLQDEYEIIEAENGQEGVELTRKNKPDLILLDLSLPVLDGWEAARTIKADPHLRHIPIIAITAHAMVGDEEKALRAGCDAYFAKPVDFGELEKAVKQWLGAT